MNPHFEAVGDPPLLALIPCDKDPNHYPTPNAFMAAAMAAPIESFRASFCPLCKGGVRGTFVRTLAADRDRA